MTDDATVEEEHLLRDGLAVLDGQGTGLASRFLRTRVHHRTASHPVSVADAQEVLVHELTANGRVVADEAFPDGRCRIVGVMGSGYVSLNPAVITISITPEPGRGCAVAVRAVAKEGLISQKTARKAADRLEQALFR